MTSIIQKTKELLQRLNATTKGEINYAQFEKLESKKYPHNQIRDEPCFRKHHPYRCTEECFRKR